MLPAHRCTSVAAGDFDGDGRVDLAFLTEGRVRLFHQTDLGIEAKEYVDTPIEGVQLGAADLDGDGHAELIVTAGRPAAAHLLGRRRRHRPGALVGRAGSRRVGATRPCRRPRSCPRRSAWAPWRRWRSRSTWAPDRWCSSAGREAQFLVPVTPERGFGPPLRFACRNALSVASGDFDGDGRIDLAFACRDFEDGRECSWVYWGAPDGFAESSRLAVPTHRACDRGPGRPARQRRLRPGDLPAAHGAVVHGGLAGVCRRQPPARRPGGAADARRTAGARRPFSPTTRCRRWCSPTSPAGARTWRWDSYLYYGGRDGFSPERRTDLRSPGAAEALACDVVDDGWADVILINSYENAIHLDAGSFVYFGGPGGFSAEPDVVIPTRLGWACAIADLDRDGYLDLIVSHFHDPTITIYHGRKRRASTSRIRRS